MQKKQLTFYKTPVRKIMSREHETERERERKRDQAIERNRKIERERARASENEREKDALVKLTHSLVLLVGIRKKGSKKKRKVTGRGAETLRTRQH